MQMRTATSILFLVTLLTALLPACKEVKRDVVATPANRDSVVSMKTRDVMTLISDSGMTRYRITAKLWLVYDEARVRIGNFLTVCFLKSLTTISRLRRQYVATPLSTSRMTSCGVSTAMS